MHNGHNNSLLTDVTSVMVLESYHTFFSDTKNRILFLFFHHILLKNLIRSEHLKGSTILSKDILQFQEQEQLYL